MVATGAKKQPKQQLDYDIDDIDDIDDDDAMYTTRSHTSVRRYNQPVEHDTIDDPLLERGTFIQRRRSRTSSNPGNGIASKAVSTSKPLVKMKQTQRQEPKRFPLLTIFLGMLVMALLALGLTAFGSWWRIHLDDMQYGRPRTFQLDAVVGHGDSPSNPTHFIFMNLNRHVQIIELPGGDSAHAHIYSGPILFGDGQDLTPITGEIRDVNGDGKPDIIVHIQDQQLILINDGTQFRPQRSGEHVNV